MLELITPAIKQAIVSFTMEHADAWRADHPDWRNDQIEWRMRKFRQKKRVTTETFDLWLAIKVRCAQFKQEISVSKLWDNSTSIYDVQVHRAMPIHLFKWFNRHISFASRADATAVDRCDDCDEEEDDVEIADADASEDDDDEEPTLTHDRQRSCRTGLDMIAAAFNTAFKPSQHMGLDEGVRANKHWGKERIRFKAAVHSGNLFDSLNCAKSKYCFWFEEHGWSRRAEGVDHHTIKSRLLRASKCLLDADGELSPMPPRHALSPMPPRHTSRALACMTARSLPRR